jgi:DNA-binding CsgD family transcriptional regulator
MAPSRVAPGPIEAACFELHPDSQIIVNSEWEVVASNRAARRLLAEAHGARTLAERLVGGAGELMREVREQIVATIRSQVPSDEFLLTVTPSLSFTLRAVPLGAAFDRALLIVRRREAVEARVARERFRFTPAESHVAERLSRGQTVSQIAQELGISIETVRCHLKQAYAKAGVHRQAELVAVMLGR